MSEGFWNRSLPNNIWEMTHTDLVYERFKRQGQTEQAGKAARVGFINPLMDIQFYQRFCAVKVEMKPQHYLSKTLDGFDDKSFSFNMSTSEIGYRNRTRTVSDSSTSSNTRLNICTYCRNINLPYVGHTKEECFALASLNPCKICFASGADNHTATYCPYKPKTILKLKPEYVIRYFNRRRAGSLPII